MKVYHGSKYVIKSPKYKGSNSNNDYGPAFYTSQNISAADEWASKNDSIGIVNEYKINTRNLKILDLTDKTKYNVLTWLSILMHFRDLSVQFKEDFASRLEWLEKNYYKDVNEYDVIIGFRADDAYFAFPTEFVRGNLTFNKLETIYLLGNLGKQVVFISEKAINRLEFVASFESRYESVGKYKNRVDDATTKFKEMLKEDMDKPGIRIGDLINEHKN